MLQGFLRTIRKPGFEQAAAENLRRIRTEGARAAFAACLARPAV